MGKLTENAWINGVGYGPGFGDRQPPGVDQPVQPTGADVPLDPTTAEGLVEAVESFTNTVLRSQLEQLPDDKAVLVEFAERHDLEVDNRLGAVKLRVQLEDLLAADEQPANDAGQVDPEHGAP